MVEIPKAAQAHTPEGAEAYFRFFMDRVSAAWTKPQAGLVAPLGVPECVACGSFEKTAKDLVSNANRYEHRPSTLISASASPDGDGQIVHVVLQQHKVNVVNKAGEVVRTDPDRRFSGDAKLVWKGGRWWIFDMG